MYYYRARWYDSNLGRFVSEDPIGFAGGDVNLYGYVWNNPQAFTDPSGLSGSDLADWLDDKIDTAHNFYGYDPIISYNPFLGNRSTLFGECHGFADLFRVGNGTGEALFANDDNIYGRLANVAADIQRASNLFAILGGAGSRLAAKPPTRIPWDSWENYPKRIVNGQEYAEVGNRLYSEHAVNRMQPSGMRYTGGGEGKTGGMPQIRQTGPGYEYGRGVAPQYVEDAISTSRPVLQPNGNISHTSGSLQVILNQQGGVVTIITH